MGTKRPSMGGGGYRDPLAIVGETPNVAARLQGIAEPDTVVISEATHRLVQGLFTYQDLGPQELKGVSTPIPVYRVLGESEVQSRFEAATRAGLTPLVGRGEELALLLERWERAKEKTGQVVLLTGEAGIGKSCLLQELKERVIRDGYTRIEFRCSPYYQHTAFYPVIDHLQRLLQFQRDNTPTEKLDKLEEMLRGYHFPLQEMVPLFAALLSLPQTDHYPPSDLTPQQQRQKTQEALGAWLLGEAKKKPLLAAWEDLQWADPSTLELHSLFMDQIATARILSVLTCRPEFNPSWGTHAHLSQLTLSRLPRNQVEAMVDKVTAGKALPAEVLQQVVVKTDGVPLFVEELTKMVLESGLVRRTNNHYELTGPLPPLAIPSTLQDSLMARLDRLAAVKELAQLGATLGREFPYELLRVVWPAEETTLQRGLATLVQAELLYQRGVPPQARYSFRHALIQDAAYHSLLVQRRKELHKVVGQALEDLYADRLTEHQEELAYHYERGEVWEKALEYLVKAGQKLQQAYANQEALAHYNRALAVCERLGAAVEPATLMTLYTGKGWVLQLLNEFPPSIEAFERLLKVARQVGDRVQEAQALSFLGVSFFTVHEFEKALDYAEQAKVLASEIGANNILAESIHEMGLVHEVTGNLGEATRCYEESLRISREAGYKRFEGLSLNWLGLLNNWTGEYEQALHLHEQAVSIGKTHNIQDVLLIFLWTRGVARCGKGEYEQALASLQEGLELSDRLGEKLFKCRLLNTLGWVYGELYDSERAIRYNKEGAEVSYTLGDPESIRNAEINLGDYYLLLGDREQAQQYLEKVYRDSQQRGKWGEEFLKWRYSQHCCHSLGELWLVKGDADKALMFAEECLKLAEPTESRKNIVKGWRLQGQAYCMQGRLAEAEAMLQKALAMAKQIGNPPQLWKTYHVLGELYERQGATDQARSAYASAIEVIEEVASRLQDQELKRVFLSARPVQEIRQRQQKL